MTEVCLEALAETLPAHRVTDEAIECHHNYSSRERHAGADVFVHPQGRDQRPYGPSWGSWPGRWVPTPYIVRGRGNAESFHSCAHGAGRLMSRGLQSGKAAIHHSGSQRADRRD